MLDFWFIRPVVYRSRMRVDLSLLGRRACLLLALVMSLFFQIATPTAASAATFASWSQTGSTAAWKGVTCSTNCETAYAPVSSGSIWKSIDGGTSWNELTGSGTQSWTSVATSGDGAVVFATVTAGGIYKSTDSGSSWSLLANAGTKNWISIATNLDGTIVVAGVNSGALWSSVDGGSNWSQQSSPGTNRSWNSIDLTDDGTTIVASGNTGGLWRGTGTPGSWTWSNIVSGKSATDSTNVSSQGWNSVVIDSTGTKIAATALDLFFSNDSGATWKHVTSGNYYWISLAGSSDLKKMIMVSADGANSNCRPHLITTSDYSTFTESYVGTVWVAYSSVAMAKDASRAIATTASSYIYRSGDLYTPSIATTTSLSTAGNVRQVEMRTSVTITATISAPGRVTFFANGKRIGNCISILGTSTATCSYKSSVIGFQWIKATLKPSTVGYVTSTSSELPLVTVKRTTFR